MNTITTHTKHILKTIYISLYRAIKFVHLSQQPLSVQQVYMNHGVM